ncbi:MAG: diaminopimelate decarboxylase [Gemmatimonadetes bacterium]|nr:diaminopimelate decarboxylase [Gemmatimonadota bacterium]
MGGIAIDAIAADVGTPSYLYHAGAIRQRFQALGDAFAGRRIKIHYAVKANANLAILRLFRDMGAGADIVSGGELARARAAGFPNSDIVFSGVGKTTVELAEAIEAGIGSINIESAEELDVIERLVEGRSVTAPVRLGLRVNPGVGAETHPYIATGVSGIKFGIPVELVTALGQRISVNPRLRLVTLAVHLGSQLLDPEPIAQGAAVLADLVQALRGRGIRTIEALDVGGGLGIRYRDETPLDPVALATALAPHADRSGLALHLEPGRYLVGSAGVLVTKVLYRKSSGGKRFVVVDAGMNDLVRPSHYQAYHAIVETRRSPRGTIVADVVGPVCETGDFLALDRLVPDVQPGENLAILGAGAYGFVMASNYNTRPRPAEVLVDRGRYALIRPRETVAQLMAGEVVEPFARETPS